jgi:hypothetical protein
MWVGINYSKHYTFTEKGEGKPTHHSNPSCHLFRVATATVTTVTVATVTVAVGDESTLISGKYN